MLDREEYVEQAYLFRSLGERMKEQGSTQDLLASVREEILSTTKLPLALDYMASELRVQGVFATAMAKLSHYFAPFQTYVVSEAENDRGRFDLRIALKILEREADYRGRGASPQGIFLYQFEAICRNRLGYDKGLDAMAGDPIFDDNWKHWIQAIRPQIGIVDFGDLIYVRSESFAKAQAQRGLEVPADRPILFGEKEGRIAQANRRKDPLLLFAALHRQLGYPPVPRPEPVDQTPQIIPALQRRMERLEVRMKMLEEEAKGGLDLSKFYGPPPVDE